MTTTALRSPRAIFRNTTGPRGFLLGFFAALAVGLVALVGASTAIGLAHSGQVLPGVRIGSVDVGGLDRAAAAERLSQQLPSLSNGQATINVNGEPVGVSFAELGRGYEIDRMVDAAFAVGRDGNPVVTTGARLRSVIASTGLPVLVRPFDAEAMDAVAVRIALQHTVASTDASVALADGAFVVTDATDGMRLDPRVVRDALAPALATTDPADITIHIAAEARGPQVTTEVARAAADAATGMAGSALALSLGEGEDPLELTAAQLAPLVRFGAVGGAYAASVDEPAAEALIAALAEDVNRDPQGARFAFGTAGPTGVIAGVTGRELDVDASLAAFKDALAERAAGATVPSMALATTVTEPSLTTAAAEAALPRMQRISTWTTNYVPGIANYYGANISIPAWAIDGRTMAPGEWFSFWGSIGEVSRAAGYGSGGVIINGRSYPTGALAGGICSTSTTIFNAALRAGLNIGDRTNHSYYINRYPLGLDATVLRTDTYTTDMTFQNDTASPILIRGYAAAGFVRFDVWSVPNGRTVTLSEPAVSNSRAAGDITVSDPNLPAGTAIRDESPHNGMDVSVTRWVHDADGTLVHQNTFFSPYRTVNGVTRVGAG